jgi:crotonobetainyl-CoA:carnitine CoA-transferase CaiB-like acyl-CoA transferase
VIAGSTIAVPSANRNPAALEGKMAGALAGITVIGLAGIGPAPCAGMMPGDHGARVIRIERPGHVTRPGVTEAPRHPHNAARSTFIAVGGVIQPAPAPVPRCSGTPAPQVRMGRA